MMHFLEDEGFPWPAFFVWQRIPMKDSTFFKIQGVGQYEIPRNRLSWNHPIPILSFFLVHQCDGTVQDGQCA